MNPEVKTPNDWQGEFHRFAFMLSFKRRHKDDMVRLTSSVRALVDHLRTNDPNAFARFTVKSPFDPGQVVVDILIGLSANLAKPLAERVAQEAILHLRRLLGIARESRIRKSKRRSAAKKK